ncbi:hypothetical protein CHUAL_001948 [Chamberlinius hualienensis]
MSGNFYRYFITAAYCLVLTTATLANMSDKFAYVGTYSPRSGQGKGIYVYRINSVDGSWNLVDVTETNSPSFLLFNREKNRLYAVNELNEYDGQEGLVSSFSIDQLTGKLAFLASQPTNGTAPCHLSLDEKEKFLLIANYGTGTVATYEINDDGSVGNQTNIITNKGQPGPNKDRQQGPHAHMVYFVPPVNNTPNIHVVDLGVDRIFQYEFDNQTGKILLDNTVASWVAKPGAGPRHSFGTNDGKFLYAINELDSTISVYPTATCSDVAPLQTVSTLPTDYNGESYTAEISIHLDKFIYGSNRGHDSIAIFSVDRITGFLSLIGHESTGGKTPRHFYIDGDFLFAANQNSNSIFKFKISNETGTLTNLGKIVEVPNPVCVILS